MPLARAFPPFTVRETFRKRNSNRKEISIENIIVVTHTAPLSELSSDKYSFEQNGMMYNSKMKKLIKLKKIKKWIFGHLHHRIINEFKNDINFICNPRGTPKDSPRGSYKILTIELP